MPLRPHASGSCGSLGTPLPPGPLLYTDCRHAGGLGQAPDSHARAERPGSRPGPACAHDLGGPPSWPSRGACERDTDSEGAEELGRRRVRSPEVLPADPAREPTPRPAGPNLPARTESAAVGGCGFRPGTGSCLNAAADSSLLPGPQHARNACTELHKVYCQNYDFGLDGSGTAAPRAAGPGQWARAHCKKTAARRGGGAAPGGCEFLAGAGPAGSWAPCFRPIVEVSVPGPGTVARAARNRIDKSRRRPGSRPLLQDGRTRCPDIKFRGWLVCMCTSLPGPTPPRILP